MLIKNKKSDAIPTILFASLFVATHNKTSYINIIHCVACPCKYVNKI